MTTQNEKSPPSDPLLNLSIQTQAAAVGLVETPVVTISDVPASINVGDKITPKVNVKRADGTTPVAGAKVTFFVEDSHGTIILGTTQTTDASGNATASESYFVADTEASTSISFSVVVWPKAV